MRTGFVFLAALALLVGCSAPPASSEPAVSPTPSALAAQPAASEDAPLATPVSDSPAAGICGGSEGPILTVTIYPDIPDPRCAIVRPDQQLRVVNRRAEVLQVSLAGLTASLEPEAEVLFEIPFGRLLAPGVHRIDVSPCCGAELWLLEGS